MEELKEVIELFHERRFHLDYETIVSMYESNNSSELNNVIVGIRKECFGLLAENDLDYQLFYISGKQLNGEIIALNIEEKYRDDLLFQFSLLLSKLYDDLEPINVFNTFQGYTRSYLEKNNRLTITSVEWERMEQYDFELLAVGVRGVHFIPFFRKEHFYKQYFNCVEYKEGEPTEDYIYLMMNLQTDLIKIGTSIRPTFREKTLQSQEPEVYLIAHWKAPKEVERQLHKKFRDKRRRGEWFQLNFGELRLIKEFMRSYV